jgi:hypothetical protein
MPAFSWAVFFLQKLPAGLGFLEVKDFKLKLTAEIRGASRFLRSRARGVLRCIRKRSGNAAAPDFERRRRPRTKPATASYHRHHAPAHPKSLLQEPSDPATRPKNEVGTKSPRTKTAGSSTKPATSNSHRLDGAKRSSRKKSARVRGQQKIDSERAQRYSGSPDPRALFERRSHRHVEPGQRRSHAPLPGRPRLAKQDRARLARADQAGTWAEQGPSAESGKRHDHRARIRRGRSRCPRPRTARRRGLFPRPLPNSQSVRIPPSPAVARLATLPPGITARAIYIRGEDDPLGS